MKRMDCFRNSGVLGGLDNQASCEGVSHSQAQEELVGQVDPRILDNVAIGVPVELLEHSLSMNSGPSAGLPRF